MLQLLQSVGNDEEAWSSVALLSTDGPCHGDVVWVHGDIHTLTAITNIWGSMVLVVVVVVVVQ